MKTIARKELQDMLEDHEVFTLIHVLPADDAHQDHIPGSLAIPFMPIPGLRDVTGAGADVRAAQDFARLVEELVVDQDEKVVLYGGERGCVRSRRACLALDDAGFRSVRVYDGGLADWLAAGLPVETGVHA